MSCFFIKNSVLFKIVKNRSPSSHCHKVYRPHPYIKSSSASSKLAYFAAFCLFVVMCSEFMMWS
jgi:hypothetical protein